MIKLIITLIVFIQLCVSEIDSNFLEWMIEEDISIKEMNNLQCLSLESSLNVNVDMDCINIKFPSYSTFKRRMTKTQSTLTPEQTWRVLMKMGFTKEKAQKIIELI